MFISDYTQLRWQVRDKLSGIIGMAERAFDELNRQGDDYFQVGFNPVIVPEFYYPGTELFQDMPEQAGFLVKRTCRIHIQEGFHVKLYSIENAKTGERLRDVPEHFVDNILDQGYIQDDYFIDPVDTIRILNIQPGIHYATRKEYEHVWNVDYTAHRSEVATLAAAGNRIVKPHNDVWVRLIDNGIPQYGVLLSQTHRQVKGRLYIDGEELLVGKSRQKKRDWLGREVIDPYAPPLSRIMQVNHKIVREKRWFVTGWYNGSAIDHQNEDR